MVPKFMKAPFPYPGGKTKIADLVWHALDQPEVYFEPFFGSGAVLLGRPNYDHQRHTEIVNDADGFVSNVWRSIILAPNDVIKWCDWPVSHLDFTARRQVLIDEEPSLTQRLKKDPEWYNAKLAAYWIWVASSCVGPVGPKMKSIDDSRPNWENKCLNTIDGTTRANVNRRVVDWLTYLSIRLRYVKVMCGDWSILCKSNWQADHWRSVGYFFDPPYSVDDRSANLYGKESLTISHAVRKWAIERGQIKNYRIVIAGYDTEHADLEKYGWSVRAWHTKGGWANQGGGGTEGVKNAKRERLWFSPYCISFNTLFDDGHKFRRQR